MRRIVMMLCVSSVVAIAGCAAKPPSQPESLTVVSYGGGAYQESHIEALFQPYTQATGTKVNSVVWDANYGRLKAMVESGDVPWDVVEVTSAQYQRGIDEGIYERLLERPADASDFRPGTIGEYGVANVYWGTVLAFRKDAFRGVTPETWRDFWDVTRFPGPRALYDDPRGNLEFALLADGVPKTELYPLDVERAFRKLEEIKPHVRVWWSDGTQPVQLLKTGAVAMSSAWNGRLFAVRSELEDVGYVWDGAALELDWWVIPKGSGHVEASSRFIAFASSADRLARQAELIGYGPVNRRAVRLIDSHVLVHIPTTQTNWPRTFVVDASWWRDHEDEMKARWIAWKAQ